MNFTEYKYYLLDNILTRIVCCPMCEEDVKSYNIKDLVKLKYLEYIFNISIISKNEVYDDIKIDKTGDLFFELVRIKRNNNVLELNDFLTLVVEK